MAISKTYSTSLLASTAVAAGSTKASPGATTSPVIDVSSYYGVNATYSITNAGTLSTAGSLTFQISGDGTNNWRDVQTIGGDLVNGSNYTGCVEIPRTAKYLRAIAYGNVGASVTFAAELNAVTAL